MDKTSCQVAVIGDQVSYFYKMSFRGDSIPEEPVLPLSDNNSSSSQLKLFGMTAQKRVYFQKSCDKI
jgi:hypothetical protein